MNKKAQGISLNVIVIAAIALLVLVILSVILMGYNYKEPYDPAKHDCNEWSYCEEGFGELYEVKGSYPNIPNATPALCIKESKWTFTNDKIKEPEKHCKDWEDKPYCSTEKGLQDRENCVCDSENIGREYDCDDEIRKPYKVGGDSTWVFEEHCNLTAQHITCISAHEQQKIKEGDFIIFTKDYQPFKKGDKRVVFKEKIGADTILAIEQPNKINGKFVTRNVRDLGFRASVDIIQEPTECERNSPNWIEETELKGCVDVCYINNLTIESSVGWVGDEISKEEYLNNCCYFKITCRLKTSEEILMEYDCYGLVEYLGYYAYKPDFERDRIRREEIKEVMEIKGCFN